MKVAVCIYGEIRGNTEVWQKIRDNLVIPNNADVFMNNVYYNTNFIDELSIDAESKQYLQLYYAEKGVYYTPPKELFEILRPKEYLLQSRPVYPTDKLEAIRNKFSHRSIVPGQTSNPLEYHTLINQNESRKWCLKMRKLHEERTGMKYDMVILTRLDADVIHPMPVCHPELKHDMFAKHLCGNQKIYEQLMFGAASKVDALCTYVDALPDMYIELCDDLHPIGMNEYFIAQFLIRQGIFVHNFDVPLNFMSHCNGLKRQNQSFVQSI